MKQSNKFKMKWINKKKKDKIFVVIKIQIKMNKKMKKREKNKMMKKKRINRIKITIFIKNIVDYIMQILF